MQTDFLQKLSAAQAARINCQKDVIIWLNLHRTLCTDLQNNPTEQAELYHARDDKSISMAEYRARISPVRHRRLWIEDELEKLRKTIFNAVKKRYEAEGEVDEILARLHDVIESEKNKVMLWSDAETSTSFPSDELVQAIERYETLDKAVKKAEKIERLAKLQSQIAQVEHQYAEEVGRMHWRIWKAEQALTLGASERNIARAAFELAKEKLRAVNRRLAEMDDAKMKAIVTRLEAEDAMSREGRKAKKLKEVVDGIPSISAVEKTRL